MKALDTCVLVRAIVADDDVQTPLAERQLAAGGFVSLTVILELAWVLQSRYRYSRALVASTITNLCDHPVVVVAQDRAMRWVADRIRVGADVGDLIHLMASQGCDTFVTFDDMARKVGDDAPLPIELIG